MPLSLVAPPKSRFLQLCAHPPEATLGSLPTLIKKRRRCVHGGHGHVDISDVCLVWLKSSYVIAPDCNWAAAVCTFWKPLHQSEGDIP